MLGALNAVTLKMITVTSDTMVKADTMMDWLVKLRAEVSVGSGTLVVILDNARYQLPSRQRVRHGIGN